METEFLVEIFSQIFISLKVLLNSSFGTALVGATAGAWIAIRFALRLERNKIVQDQLNSANLAVVQSLAVFNFSIGFKEQLSAPLVEEYFSERDRFKECLSDGGGGAFEYNFIALKMFDCAFFSLPALVSKSSSTNGKVQLAAMVTQQSLVALDECIKQRQDCVTRLSKLQAEEDSTTVLKRYFGIRDEVIGIDTGYKDSIEGIQHQLDTVIYLSKLVGEAMAQRAQNLNQKLGKRGTKPIQFGPISKVGTALIPDATGFADWQ